MKIQKITGGSLMSNGYVLYEKDGGSCLIIDPGYGPQKFIDFVTEQKLHCDGIILTHLHHDHTGAADSVADYLDCPIYMHETDACVYKGKVDRYLYHHDALHLDGEELRILHTPGHTGGSICILAEKSRVCFTGDTLFDTDLGRTDLAGGSEKQLRESIKNVIDRWENYIYIYPGHDGGCTMKSVRQNNPEFLALRDGNER
ncbi:MAG: MBL fold metallo-hydrolase [Emergencia sp.]|nr:MBL fold metallo-hydrolase [Emergencia sp.]